MAKQRPTGRKNWSSCRFQFTTENWNSFIVQFSKSSECNVLSQQCIRSVRSQQWTFSVVGCLSSGLSQQWALSTFSQLCLCLALCCLRSVLLLLIFVSAMCLVSAVRVCSLASMLSALCDLSSVLSQQCAVSTIFFSLSIVQSQLFSSYSVVFCLSRFLSAFFACRFQNQSLKTGCSKANYFCQNLRFYILT